MVPAITLIALLFAVCVRSYFIGFVPFRLPRWGRIRPDWLFGAQLLCVLLWQLARIRNEEYNVDESTWIANALAVLAEKDTVAALLNYTTSRPMTVLPLVVLAKLHLPLTYASIKVVGLLFITLALWLTYSSLRTLTTPRLAVLFLFPLLMFYFTVQFDDFLAYNSELICNVSIAAGLWLYSLIVSKRDQPWQVITVALGLGILPLTKFQAIPGGLIVAGLCVYALVRQQRLRVAGVLIVAGVFPLVATILYCLLTDQLTVLVRSYFLYYFNYAYQYSQQPLQNRLSPGAILYYYRQQHTFAAYWFGLLLAMGVGLWYTSRKATYWSALRLFSIGLCGISVYETIQAGTYFEHYLTLTLIPLTLLAAVLVYPAVAAHRIKVQHLAYGYVAIGLFISFFSRTKPFDRGYHPPLSYDAEIVALIRRECRPTDRISIWGWADRYYALSHIAPAGRYTNCVLQVKPNAEQTYHLQQYQYDLQQNRPMLFVDAVAAHQFTYVDTARYAQEHFPIINQFVRQHYRLIYNRYGLRVYKLKAELAAK